MKRRWTITLIVILAVAAAVPVFKYWPRTSDDSECSAYYRSWQHRDGVRATYIKGKSLNDTLRVDLTLLQATDSEGWALLCREFDIAEADTETKALLQEGNPDIVLSILSPTPVDFADTVHVAAASRALQCVSIFHTTTMEQFNLIVENHIDQLLQ